MKAREKISKALMIALTLFIITSLSTPNTVTAIRADALGTKASTTQLKSSGPHGPEGQPLADVEEMMMPAVDSEKLLQEAQQRSWDEPPRFATALPVQLNPATAGTWETLENGLQLWRLRITSTDAVSLNTGFTAYHMPPGGELYIYSPDYGQILGPYTAQDNAAHGQLWTPIVEGSEIVIEVSLPASEVSQLQLELSSVNHGFIDFETAEKSGSCNRDVVCAEGNSWRSQIRSVGRFTISGSFLCSGSLINNTAQNFKPFFLTANHCLNTAGAAASVVVYWNYDCPTCRTLNSAENGTPISTAGAPTQTGAFLRATYAPSDMTLLELDSPVDAGVNAFWSGWDRRGFNATSAVAIHHPQGHEKRISFENQATSITSYLQAAVPGNGTHIRVADWDLGTTEGGSSGSPLFDQNGRIIGQLHGGFAACGNNDADWYGRLFTSWTGGGTNANRLSNWLDPGNTGAQTLNGLTQPSVGDVFEPDNTSAQAKTINLNSTQTHSIRPATDIDWLKFQLTVPSAVTVETSGGPVNGDTRLWLYNSSLAEIRFDDDSGVGNYSYINTCDVVNLPAGTYYVKVDEFNNNNEISSYKISVSAGDNCLGVALGGAVIDAFPVYPGASTRQYIPGVDNGPVEVFNIDGNPIIAAERVIYKVGGAATSFTEMMGLPDSLLDNTYWLPWYNNIGLDSQLRFANVSNSSASIEVFIGTEEMPGSPFSLDSGESTRISFAGVDNGPVRIVSTQDIVAAERVIYKVGGHPTSFSEIMALPNSQLSNTYWLPWYDNVNKDTQLRFGNVSGSTASVQVFIGGAQMTGSPFTLAPGESTRKSFTGINGGPVKIVSNQNIVAAERVIYKVNNAPTSFTEMMALPNGQLNTTQWLPWYNNQDLETDLRIGNAGNSMATVHVYIGGTEMAGSPFTIGVNASVIKTYPNISDGPVMIVSNVPIVISEGEIFKFNNVRVSFSEMLGLPNSLLDTSYWFPWYNNIGLDTQLRFGVP